MQNGALEVALEREHREIDEGIEAFRATTDAGLAGAQIATLSRAIEALRRHIYLEEEFVFPGMRAEFAIPIGVMLREHGEIWQTMDMLEAKLSESDTSTAILQVCDELLSQLDRHNAKEEPIFYTQVDRALSADEITNLKALLDSGQMPTGWICQAARYRAA